MGNKTNIILVGADGRIIDSLRRSDPEKDERTAIAGAYKYPDSQHKLNPVTGGYKHNFGAAENYGGDLEKALLFSHTGLFTAYLPRNGFIKRINACDFRSALNSVLYGYKVGRYSLLFT